MITSSNGNICALLALCAGNSTVIGDFSAQRPVTRSFYVFFDLCLNKRLTKHSWGGWVETPSPSLWRHCHAIYMVSLPYSLPKTSRLSLLNQFPPLVNFLRWREYREHSFCIKCHYICVLKRIFWGYTIFLFQNLQVVLKCRRLQFNINSGVFQTSQDIWHIVYYIGLSMVERPTIHIFHVL